MTFGKILVVDDDPELLKALSLQLSGDGFNVNLIQILLQEILIALDDYTIVGGRIVYQGEKEQ